MLSGGQHFDGLKSFLRALDGPEDGGDDERPERASPQSPEPWTESELARKAAVEAGRSVTAHINDDARLIEWAEERGLYVRIDRKGEWGNPYEVGRDGSRDEVIGSYEVHLAKKPSLGQRLGELRGKVLGCWCYPERCHGDVLIRHAYGEPVPSIVEETPSGPAPGDDRSSSGDRLDAVPAEIAEEIAEESGPARHRLFNLTNDNVDWARWTWNPITGCEHTCIYCYARDIANRFYPEKFAPTFRPERLEAPRHTKVPESAIERFQLTGDAVERTAWRNVFVCSMADLFGRWVPAEWIDAVFDSCRQSPEWNYLFLTKFPQRYAGLDFPETSWVGTSVDEQKRVANAEKAFRKIDVPVRWLSVEPMLEPIEFGDLRMFDWVVIGGQSRSSGAPASFPDPAWVDRLIDRALAANCAVYCKPNTDPGRHWAGLFQQYPSAFGTGRDARCDGQLRAEQIDG
jgi:protein gp37